MKQKRKSSFLFGKVNSSKPYPKFLYSRKRNSVEVSRNFYFNKRPFNFNVINTPNSFQKPINFQRFQSSKLMKK